MRNSSGTLRVNSNLNQEEEEEEVVQQKDAQVVSKSRETRRVQLTGGSTLVVSLPSGWARGVGLKAKDEVYMVPQTDMSLLVIPGTRAEKIPERTIEISQKDDEDEILRSFIAYYVSGFDVIRLKFKTPQPELRSKLKTHIRHKLIGVEIVEETTDNILAQCLHGNVDLPLKKALSRMSIIASSMQFDAVKSLTTSDPALAREWNRESLYCFL
ncbi:MAG: AbrB/MazE/SpoVT family DNA-binding domain-containing protein [Rhabdochlamydiaceae bacterium]